MVDFAADSILVVLDVTPGGDLASSAAGLLGAAAGVGTPVALIVAADAALQALAQDAADLGAAVVLTATGDAERLTVPTVDARAGAAARVAPDAVVRSHSVDGRDVAGRFAARTRSALAVDAVGLSRDEEGVVAHHSVYGGAYSVDAAATFGAGVVTIRQGSVDARAEVQPLVTEALEVTPSGRRAATVESVEEAATVSTRPELRGAAKVVSGGRGLGSQEKFAL
ncbi:MAG: electron transfer flavoprotein subunit alpha/FixB family protein, partial [Microbacterium sp.]|nr:electron transfer flavoprotein subunit alpha/FixB family protein [Microbacterium sp.]